MIGPDQSDRNDRSEGAIGREGALRPGEAPQ
jgi:hypothetical protein